VWSLGGRRSDPLWLLIGFAFALVAVGDSIYVVQAARGEWTPGGMLDVPYTIAVMLLAVAAWLAPPAVPMRVDRGHSRVVPPAVFALAALCLTVYAGLAEINPLAWSLALLALFAVVLRLGVSLARSNRQSAALAALAAIDPLTGLAHHGALHERLVEHVDAAGRDGAVLAVVALDVDDFKSINDRHGHAMGDWVLERIAVVLAEQLRSIDVAARVGGDEFVLLLPGAIGRTAVAVAERCRTALLAITVQGAPVGCSAGVSAYPDDAADAPRLLKAADGALYAAKRSGRSQVHRFDLEQDLLVSDAERHREVLRAMGEDGALRAHFQPVVELATGRVAGYEALTRFAGAPVRPPNVWFAQARGCGLGNALEARAIEVALAVPGRPPGTFLSVNVSPTGLLSREVEAVLPADLSDLVVELTEEETFTCDQALDLRIAALRERGARIAIDDAGAGYAGLQQIIRIKPDILKLDRALIKGIDTDGSKVALLGALASFAVTTGAAVCGEGIETADELRTVAGFDVTYVQGFLLGRPGAPWPAVDGDVVRGSALPALGGMRVAADPGGGPLTLGTVTDALAAVRSRSQLDAALRLLRDVTASDDAAVSRVDFGQGLVQTLSEHAWAEPEERYRFEDYPSTARIVTDQILGQVVDGDHVADPAEVAPLHRSGFAAVLMAPVVLGGETIGLLELYRRASRPWTPTEMDQVRMLAHQIGPVVGLVAAATGHDAAVAGEAPAPGWVARV